MTTDQSEDAHHQPPSVSVLMPVYNGGEYVAKAIDSILSQTLTDFELVIVDDGSTDNTASILARYAHDARLRVVRHAENQGLVSSLNHGLQNCRAELVARLDADDISKPNRLQLQKSVFDSNPAVKLCATAYERFLPSGEIVRSACPPLTHGGLAMAMFTDNRLCHSSVMFCRSSVLDLGGYDPAWFPVEDYDLWIRLMETGQYAGINSIETVYMENPEGISTSKIKVQEQYKQARADVYRSSVVNALVEAMPTTPRQHVRKINALRRGVRSQLRNRGISLDGIEEEAYLQALNATIGHSRFTRHAIVGSAAPNLWLRGSIRRRR